MRNWGPTGLLGVVFTEVLGINGDLSVQLKGERVSEPSCCERKQKKEEKQTTQVSLALEAAIDGEILKNTPVGRALDLFKVNAFVRFKGAGGGSANWETDYCKADWQDTNYFLSAEIGAAGELGVRFGKVAPGSVPVSGVAVEGYGGLEAQAKVLPNPPNRPVFNIESALNLYIQLDVVTPAGGMTLFKRNFELSKQGQSTFAR